MKLLFSFCIGGYIRRPVQHIPEIWQVGSIYSVVIFGRIEFALELQSLVIKRRGMRRNVSAKRGRDDAVAGALRIAVMYPP